MKTLIVYMTKNGATKQLAESIARRIPGAETLDLKKQAPEIARYDCIVLGSPLMAGQIKKKLKEWAAAHEAELMKKTVGLYLSGLRESGGEEYFTMNYSERLLNHAKAKRLLGGIFDPAKCGFFGRMVIKAVAKTDTYTSTIKEEWIDAFVKELTA